MKDKFENKVKKMIIKNQVKSFVLFYNQNFRFAKQNIKKTIVIFITIFYIIKKVKHNSRDDNYLTMHLIIISPRPSLVSHP